MIAAERVNWRIPILAIAATAALTPITGNLYAALAVVIASALLLIIARRYGPVAGAVPRSRWQYAPAASAAVLLVLVVLTWGAAVLLAPIGIGLTIMALRRTPNWRHPLVILGVVGNGFFAAAFVAALVTLAYDAVVT